MDHSRKEKSKKDKSASKDNLLLQLAISGGLDSFAEALALEQPVVGTPSVSEETKELLSAGGAETAAVLSAVMRTPVVLVQLLRLVPASVIADAAAQLSPSDRAQLVVICTARCHVTPCAQWLAEMGHAGLLSAEEVDAATTAVAAAAGTIVGCGMTVGALELVLRDARQSDEDEEESDIVHEVEDDVTVESDSDELIV